MKELAGRGRGGDKSFQALARLVVEAEENRVKLAKGANGVAQFKRLKKRMHEATGRRGPPV